MISDLPGWERSQGIIVIALALAPVLAVSRRDGARRGGAAGQPPAGVERVLYVLEGQLDVTLPGSAVALPRSGRFRVLSP